MRRYGLTGGIASGKSVVAAILRELGFPVIEADRVAHEAIEPGRPAYEEVLAKFGREILDPDGKINRARLGAIVFNDRDKLQALNSIVHPRVEEELARRFAVWQQEGRHAAAFVEAALIYEAGLDKRLDGVIVAWCQPEQQLARLKERGMSEAEARKRIAAQMPVKDKLALATERIDCSGALSETRQQVEALARKLWATAN
ncbi:MAG TPA: dephospho-CoA kinase [Dongiaceae bacterium]|nr:dephospho-CoA kinase [Dongiaceae bacterium]